MIALFVLKLATGTALMWWLMPRKEVTDGFFRIQMRVLLGLVVLAALLLTAGQTWNPAVTEAVATEATATTETATIATAPTVASTWDAVRVATWIRALAIVVAVISYAGSIFWALGQRLPGNVCIHLVTLLCVCALGLHSVHVPNTCSTAQQLLSDFSSAALLGGVLTGMLLGHWYLTTPTMSINPLWWFNSAILVATVFRCIACLWTLTNGFALDDSTHLIWYGIRWAGGVVAPVLMAVMVWRILKHRNTQSATGVFFAGLIVVFMGEMTAALLERDTLLPY